jgi:radical SAM superfamily enzyme YgiQ (UPF0313 family)
MTKVILVNPSVTTFGYCIITPRWLFVIAQATPQDLVGDPILVDEAVKQFDPAIVQPGDIVGIGISTGNCAAGYRVLKEAKRRGATVIMGGIHATIFPDEPLEIGADAVVTGNGDVIWSQVVKDALNRKLQKRYVGGRVAGELLSKARWDLLNPKDYMFASVQTVAGCPENCSFCSVWVTDGRKPRQRLGDQIIEEVNELYDLGFRVIIFADDNFNPATLGRIAREPNPQKRRELEQIREERLEFFDRYDRSVPRNVYAFTQMTTEVTSDQEYLSAMHQKMRIIGTLIGIEAFTEEGLKNVGKEWNPIGQNMVKTIQTIQDNGILVLSSIICGLECDTVETIRTMRKFALESGTALAQFTYYDVYPGTKDFHEIMNDKKYLGKPGYVAKHKTQVLADRFWLKGTTLQRDDIMSYANISCTDLVTETMKCWQVFYSTREALTRVRRGKMREWPLVGKLVYLLFCLAFKRLYSGHGVSADSVRRDKSGTVVSIPYQVAPAAIVKLFLRTLVRFAARTGAA